jgi:hypothetical protein
MRLLAKSYRMCVALLGTRTQSTGSYSVNATRLLRWLMVTVAAVFFVLHFLHLNADFPNNSPWMDWSKYTDEGWYGDAAIRQILSGHWYWPGDFNPAVALPVWPALEWIVFRFTGVSPAAARALTLVVVGVTLVVVYRLIARQTRSRTESEISLAPALAILFLCCNPFLYAFDRLAIVEPLLICLTAAALLTASHLHPLKRANAVEMLKSILPSLALGILLPAMVLTKTTAISLLPAVAYMVWARAGYRLRPALRLAVVPCLLGAAIWLAYFYGFVRPHYLEDYRYLFNANSYTGIGLDPLATVLFNTVKDGMWMGNVLLVSFFAVLALTIFWRPRLLANPLVPALTLWVAGYTAFLLYHNNLQPRYYTVIAVPITVLVAIGLDNFRYAEHRAARVFAATAVTVVALAIVIPDAAEQIGFVLHPTYEFETAAQNIRRIVMATPSHSHLILSISGSDLTLMTGLPSIDDDFGTLDLDVRARLYQPGWYVAWNDIEDDKMEDLAPNFRIERVASFAALDDPERNQMIVYRLDPATAPVTAQESGLTPVARKAATPKPLLTKEGQQPSTEQVQH